MLASEPDSGLQTPPRFVRSTKRTVPSASEIALVALAVVLSLWCIFAVLTLLAHVWTGWDAASTTLLLFVALSGFGALVCVWLAWRLSSNRIARSDLLWGRDDPHTFGDSPPHRPQASRLLYCERDHVVFESTVNQTDPAMVKEHSVQ